LSTTQIKALTATQLAVLTTAQLSGLDKNGNTTLVADHAMAVYGFDTSTGMLEIYNPWGTWSGGGQNWDTTFETGLSTLLADGDTISVAANASTGLLGALSASKAPLSGAATPSLLGSTQPLANSLGLAAVT
jgi:hypothetical protein